MYLKRVELVGFKSFAEKTVLNFEPGWTAVVGPNGCGKSNISDAIRWVLGEQSAKALRGGSMADVIFNGTDTHKPLNMAEVSLTLAECEKALGMEYSEVTITRRVHRSGDSAYYLNKAPCRLKDIQRLFMDTGIGRNSYSIMEQGKIDQILSSRPEDRRAVFEEASGITKYKADRKEALRKLEQTDLNLQRSDDVIREVKRQIISLQRQAGKARRYKEIAAQMQGYEIFSAGHRLKEFDTRLEEIGNQAASLAEQLEAHREEIEQTEQVAAATREALTATDTKITEAMEQAAAARGDFEAARQAIQINQDRIRELEEVAGRDSRDADEARARQEALQAERASLETQLAASATRVQETQAALEAARATHDQAEREARDIRQTLAALRTRIMECDQRQMRLQSELNAYDERERQTLVRKERLAAEKTQTAETAATLATRLAEMDTRGKQLQEAVQTASTALETLNRQRQEQGRSINETRQRLNNLQQKAAGLKARVEVLTASEKKAEAFPGGARLVMSPESDGAIDKSRVLGPLAAQFTAEPKFQTALESCLRSWLDAIVVQDTNAAFEVLALLQDKKAGAARLLSVDAFEPNPTPVTVGEGLIDHVRFDERIAPLAQRLLGHVRVLESWDQLPEEIFPDTVLVTLDGALYRGDGSAEFWIAGEQANNPMARQALKNKAVEELTAVEKDLEEARSALQVLQDDERSAEERLAKTREEVQQARQALARHEGEARALGQEAQQAGRRAEAVQLELSALLAREQASGDQRATISGKLDAARAELDQARTESNTRAEASEAAEKARNEANDKLTEARIRLSEAQQHQANTRRQFEAAGERITELAKLIDDRSRGVVDTRNPAEGLRAKIAEDSGRLDPLRARMEEVNQSLEAARGERTGQLAKVEEAERTLRERRHTAQSLQDARNKLEIEGEGKRIHRQTLLDRIEQTYHLDAAALADAPAPAWEEGEEQTVAAAEARVSDLRGKLEAMGPVNLVAIEEHQQLEDRHQFLTAQHNDLVQAKEQLMEMIKTINASTTELFRETFNKVNENFGQMFKRLFGGGTAHLVLSDETDVLECGIEIVARPPGKKPQTISLLSGGERTMTAVALLFALYMVKPSPFCVLDELDAPLDEANIGRFIEIVQAFMEKSQFVTITHNPKTIAAADTLYGVTMEVKGVSKIVSVKFAPKPSAPAAPAAPEPEPALT